jgi:hypothetical protein
MSAPEERRDEGLGKLAVAAVTAAVLYGLKHALEDRDDPGDGGGKPSQGVSEVVPPASPGLGSVWNVAGPMLLPAAHDAAQAAGRWVARNAPDAVRERVLQPFIAAYSEEATEAGGRRRRALPGSS